MATCLLTLIISITDVKGSNLKRVEVCNKGLCVAARVKADQLENEEFLSWVETTMYPLVCK